MARYYLVGSYYNRDDKSYLRETDISILDDFNLSTLSKIDYFTSKFGVSCILDKIESELEISGLNHLSIRYGKSSPIYYRVIDKSFEYNSCVSSVKSVRVTILGNTRDMLLVDRDNPLYKEEVFKMLEIVKSRDIDLFNTIYKYNDSFNYLVLRHFGTSYDDELFEEKALKEIITCFRCYSIFRKWYVNYSLYEKGRLNLFASNNRRESGFYQSQVKENGVQAYCCDSYINYIEKHHCDEGDEFLTEEEKYEMYGGNVRPVIRKLVPVEGRRDSVDGL